MKITILSRFFNFILIVLLNLSVVNVYSQQSSNLIEVKQSGFVSWHPNQGIPYKQVPGFNLGAVSFEVIDVNTMAYLSNSSSEVIVSNASDGHIINRFPVMFAPRDFVYENDHFYVLNESTVSIYHKQGNLINQIEFDRSVIGVERLTRVNGSTYLLLPNGNSLQVESKGKATDSQREIPGVITFGGYTVITEKVGNNQYNVGVTTPQGKIFEKIYQTDKKIAGAFVVGVSEGNVIVDVQLYQSENPIEIERKIVNINLKENSLGEIESEINVPQMYYVWSNKDFYIGNDGNLYNMITAPEGIFVFTLSTLRKTIDTTKKPVGYPEFITKNTYHFNEHLLEVDEEER